MEKVERGKVDAVNLDDREIDGERVVLQEMMSALQHRFNDDKKSTQGWG
jgi:hypothetical protein